MKNYEFANSSFLDKDLDRKSLAATNGKFYQYRPCQIFQEEDSYRIYDLENIYKDQVVARSPLYMNDPYDSTLGYSLQGLKAEFFQKFARTYPERIGEDSIRKLFPLVGLHRLEDLFSLSEHIQKVLETSQGENQNLSDPNERIAEEYEILGEDLKEEFSVQEFGFLFNFLASEPSFNFKKALQDFSELRSSIMEGIERVRKQMFLPRLREEVKKVKISCFSQSGYDNHLMWAHYANSFSGICVEYDFNRLEKFDWLFKKADYTAQRPMLTLDDLGLEILFENGKPELVKTRPINWDSFFQYFLDKEKTWQYEQEWRIIYYDDSEGMQFLPMECVESITYYPSRIHPVAKQLIWDICRDKKIDCYELSVRSDSFDLSRVKVDLEKKADVSLNPEDKILYTKLKESFAVK